LICSSGLALLTACAPKNRDASIAGDAQAGAIEITRDACGSCHEIPGIEESQGRVGPSLRHFAKRRMIAGRLPNTPANLQRWLKAPQSIAPGNAMPDQGLTDQQARDVAAYLERLR
jgi:cytochrome c1